MVGESKILTVSYGTFSCTLEGFDDPFSTMRGIAEYFRDLAADDRYFGAEPPTPDAEMLHRIAEREVQRRVEARIQDDGVVLRQMEKAAPAMPAPAAAASEDEGDEEDSGEAAHAAPAPAPVEPVGPEAAAPAEEPEAEPVQVAAPADDSIAEKLRRIRAVVTAAPAYAEDEFAEPGETAYDASLDAAFADASEELYQAPEAGSDEGAAWATEEASEDSAFEEDEEDFAAGIEPAMEDLTEDEIPASAFEEEAETDFAPETAMEEVAAEEEADFAAEQAWPEPEPFEPVAEPEAAEVWDYSEEEETEEEVAAAPEAEDEAAEAEMAEETAEDDQSDLDAVSRAWDAFEPAAAAPAAPAETAEHAQPDDALAARIVKLKHAFAAPMAETAEETPEEAEEDWTAEAEEEDWAEDNAEETLWTAEEEVEETDHFDMPSTLSAEAEADLMDDLDAAETLADEEPEDEEAQDGNIFAEAEAETEDGTDEDTEDDLSEEEEPEPAHGSADRLIAMEADQSGDAAFERILEETNSQLDDTESTRRRSAIAHLKAAVAATKADRLIRRQPTEAEEEAQEQSRYREDLAKVVRPRRAEGVTTRTERPKMHDASDRPSPLVLVSELRVNGGEDGPSGSIRPKRVITREVVFDDDDEGAEMGGDGNFADFADRMGATELPDLMEAAAAYAAFVEGRKEFSRPELMRRVASFQTAGEFTREAGLRSFGQLLREGKIRKLNRGQFTIPEQTRFNPEARIAGE